MVRVILLVALVLVATLVIKAYRDEDRAARKRVWRWVVGIGIGTALAMVLVRTGFHWVGIAGVTAFALLRRLAPILWRVLPFAHRAWKRRHGATAGDASRSDGQTIPAPNQMTRAEALEVLGLKPGATREEISGAYRQLIQKVHPDKPGGSNYIATRLNQAKQVLLG